MVDCTICGKPIIDEAFVTANRRVYHLHHEGEDHIDIETYENIIATMKEQLGYSALEVKEKNKFLEDNLKKMVDYEKDKVQLVNDGHRLFSEKNILNESYIRVKTELANKDEELDNLNKNAKTQIRDLKKDYQRLNNKIVELIKTNADQAQEIEECEKFREKIKKLGSTDDT